MDMDQVENKWEKVGDEPNGYTIEDSSLVLSLIDKNGKEHRINSPLITKEKVIKSTITQLTKQEEENSLPYKLMIIYTLEDDEPKQGTKAHKKWEEDLLKLYKEYNQLVGFKAFNETKI